MPEAGLLEIRGNDTEPFMLVLVCSPSQNCGSVGMDVSCDVFTSVIPQINCYCHDENRL